MFKITDHIEFDPKGRASCPVCQTEKGKVNKNLALVPDTDGAYKCHRGCSPQDIREYLGQPKQNIIPSAIANQKPIKYHSEAEIKSNTENLLNNSKLAKKWLKDRGITEENIKQYNLGIVHKEIKKYEGKKLIDQKTLPCITIPYEYPEGYLQKYFIAPWLDSAERFDQRIIQDLGITSRFWFTEKGYFNDLIICEGEWDAIILANYMGRGICTLTTGAGNVPKDLSELDQFQEIYIFYDLDQAGKDGAIKLAKAIGSKAKICTVPHPENAKSGWDVSDAWLNGFILRDFHDAIANGVSLPDDQMGKKLPLKERLFTIRQLLERAPDFVEFLVHDLITANELQVLAAPPRAGKSLLAMGLIHAVASGEEFMGRPTQQGTVIYVNVEDGEAKLKERVIAQQWDPDRPVLFLNDFSLNEWQDLLLVADELKPKLIVIDTLTSVRDDEGDENSSKLASVLRPLKHAAKVNNYAVLLVHHTKKLNANLLADIDIFDTMRGSGTIRSESRGALVLAEITNKDTNRNEWRLIAENGSYAKQDLIVMLDAHSLTWKTLSNWTPNCSESQESQALAFFDKVGKATIQQLSANTSIPSKSAYTVATRLVQRGMLVKSGTRQNAYYSRPIQQIQQLNSLLNSQNPDQSSDKGNDSTKQENIFSHVETVKINNTIAVENNPICESVELEAQNQAQQGNHEFNKQFNNSKSVEFQIGDKVEIQTGSLVGKIAQVVDIQGDEIEVKGKNWVVTRTYPTMSLKSTNLTKSN